MWFYISLILTLPLSAPPERLLLIEDTAQPNLERSLVYQQLLVNLMRDPSVQLVPSGAWPPQLHRSVALQETADLLAGDARRHLHALNPQSAAISASAARLRYSRVAALSGDLTGLAEALALDAASHLLQGHTKEAQGALKELFTLEPAFVPNATLYNRSMQLATRDVAREVQRMPKSAVCIHAAHAAASDPNSDPDIALFVDGHFVGFGPQCPALIQGVRHHLWFVPVSGEPQGQFLCPAARTGLLPADIAFTLWPKEGDERSPGNAAFGHVVASSRLATGEIDPHHPSLASRRIDTVLVLAYAEGALRLTTFELRSGQRRVTRAAAAVTDLWDVSRIAETLLVAAPPLAVVPIAR